MCHKGNVSVSLGLGALEAANVLFFEDRRGRSAGGAQRVGRVTWRGLIVHVVNPVSTALTVSR